MNSGNKDEQRPPVHNNTNNNLNDTRRNSFKFLPSKFYGNHKKSSSLTSNHLIRSNSGTDPISSGEVLVDAGSNIGSNASTGNGTGTGNGTTNFHISISRSSNPIPSRSTANSLGSPTVSEFSSLLGGVAAEGNSSNSHVTFKSEAPLKLSGAKNGKRVKSLLDLKKKNKENKENKSITDLDSPDSEVSSPNLGTGTKIDKESKTTVINNRTTLHKKNSSTSSLSLFNPLAKIQRTFSRRVNSEMKEDIDISGSLPVISSPEGSFNLSVSPDTLASGFQKIPSTSMKSPTISPPNTNGALQASDKHKQVAVDTTAGKDLTKLVPTTSRIPYHRSVSFQSVKYDTEKDEDTSSDSSVYSSTLSKPTTKAPTKAEKATTATFLSRPGSKQSPNSPTTSTVSSNANTPSKLVSRQRSRTVSALDHTNKSNSGSVKNKFISQDGNERSPLRLNNENPSSSETTATGNLFPGFGSNYSSNSARATTTTNSGVLNAITTFIRLRRASSFLDMENSHTFSPDPNLPTPSSDHGFIQEDVLVDDFTFPSPNMATSATASLPITPSSGSNNSLSFLTSQFPLENETPETYINRLVINNKIQKIIQLITTKDSEFNKSALDYYFNYYDFKNEVIDLSLRKFLILNELPKETQQIDRVIREFANHFYIQNQEIVYSVELCYILTFSLLVLHTDYFNPNNKKKMSKFDFVKIIIDNLENHYKDHEEFSKLEDSNELLMKNLISKEILEYYYDNITYTPFKRFEENLLNLLLRSNNNKGLELLKNDKNLSKSQKDSLMKDSNHKFTNTNVNKNEEEITRSIIRSNLSNSSMTSTSRRRASSFFSLPISIDRESVYEYVLDSKNKKELALGQFFQLDNPYLNAREDITNVKISDEQQIRKFDDEYFDNFWKNTDEIDVDIFQNLKNNLLSSEPKILLKLSKSKISFLTNQNKKIALLPNNHDKLGLDQNDNDDLMYITRVFKMGIMYKEESKKLTSTKKFWKRYFVILTSFGLIFYKDINFFKISKPFLETNNHEIIILEESQNNNIVFDNEPNMMLYNNSCNLFATRIKQNEFDNYYKDSDSHTGGNHKNKLDLNKFIIFGKNSKGVYSVPNGNDSRSWILNINYLSALSGSILNKPPQLMDINNHLNEMSLICNSSASDRLLKLGKNFKNSKNALRDLVKLCQNFQNLTPFNYKTKENLIYSAKLLNSKLSWCWFELTKNGTFMKILKYELSQQELQDITHDTTADDIVDEYDDESIVKSDLSRNFTNTSLKLLVDYRINDSFSEIAIDPNHSNSTENIEDNVNNNNNFARVLSHVKSNETVYYDC